MENLKRLREKKGLSQVELSKKSSISQSFIHDLENGYKQPTTKTLHRLAEALEVSVTDLLEGENECF